LRHPEFFSYKASHMIIQAKLIYSTCLRY
jgi:hypothetical protein